ncbi:MAG: alkaline phosphatase family protein [Spirochaetota bacterium]
MSGSRIGIDDAFATGALIHPLAGEACSVDLFRAVAELAGGCTFEKRDAAVALKEAIGHHDHYLFVLVDGLGASLAPLFPERGFLASTLRRRITSVFPSTTAVALSSLATGGWPAEHGLTGWFTYFPQHRRVLAPLLFSERGTNVPASELGFSMSDLVQLEPYLGSFFRTVRSFLPTPIADGHYAVWARSATPAVPYRSFAEARRLIRRHYRTTAGPTYTYLYITTVDTLSHDHGVGSDQVAEEVEKVDALLAALRDALPDSIRMIVTADHGLVDVPEELRFSFGDDDPLARHLVAGQTGEATTPIFHVRPGAREAFRDAFGSHAASEHFSLATPDELADRELYGPVPLAEATRRRLGDFVGIATRPALLSYIPRAGKPVSHVGVHGGLRPGEMLVPLCLA